MLCTIETKKNEKNSTNSHVYSDDIILKIERYKKKRKTPIHLPVNSVGNDPKVLACVWYSVHLGWQNLIPYQIRHQRAEKEKENWINLNRLPIKCLDLLLLLLFNKYTFPVTLAEEYRCKHCLSGFFRYELHAQYIVKGIHIVALPTIWCLNVDIQAHIAYLSETHPTHNLLFFTLLNFLHIISTELYHFY